MNAQQLLTEISDYCRRTGLAESTFGRRAVNDGKLAARLRNGGRITTETVERVRAFIAGHQGEPARARLAIVARARPTEVAMQVPRPIGAVLPTSDLQRNFRFFD